jgi:hypothetical protein
VAFDNRVLKGIFWPKREEVTGDWRKLRQSNYSSPATRVIKPRRMGFAEHSSKH